MNEQNLILNILTFAPPEKEKVFSFIKERKKGFYPIKKDEFPANIAVVIPSEEMEKQNFLYTDFETSPENSFNLNVNLIESTFFAKHYYAWLVLKYFRGVADVVECDFINDLIVWFKDKKTTHNLFDYYNLYRIRVQIKRVSDFPELVIAFHSHTRVFKQSVSTLEYDTTNYNKVIYNKQIYKYRFLPESAGNELYNVHPVLSNKLKKIEKIVDKPDPKKNCYKEFYDLCKEFLELYLNKDEFKKVIPLNTNYFTKHNPEKLLKTDKDSNLLVFSNKYNKSPKLEVSNGVFQHPSKDKAIEIFFIYHTDFENKAKHLYSFLKGYVPAHKYDKEIPGRKEKEPKFKGLTNYIGTQFNCYKESHIIYTNKTNPVTEVISTIKDRKFDTGKKKYLAIYISPVNKFTSNPETYNAYFAIKECLLEHEITSQVIFADNITTSASFDYTMQNIFVAICAKLGGIPWSLKNFGPKELIIGVGAFKSLKFDTRYIGSAFCFSNNGHFKNFKVYPENNIVKLAGSIKEAINTFKEENKDESIKRVIIHFYKKMKWKEIKPIHDILKSLKFDVPVIVVTINKTESNDYIFFDDNFVDKIPFSGLALNIGYFKYLLCNNTRYDDFSKIESYPFPIKLSFYASDEKILTSETIQQLINQVYQFSRMYWKSVRQQNLPVTIKYPEMVAEIFPHFQSKTLELFGRNNLWFL